MSPAASAEPPVGPRRVQYADELEQLRLQVEMMGLLVDRNLARMLDVLADGSQAVAAEAVAADDDIDAMNVSLTERCYSVLRRESPVAADLRLVVSVVRVTAEFERVGDLALRVVKAAADHQRFDEHPAIADLLEAMGRLAVDRFRAALRAWSTGELAEAEELAAGSPAMDDLVDRLTASLLDLRGDGAVPTALGAAAVAKSLDRISDHATVLAARVRYLVTGDPAHLASEVR